MPMICFKTIWVGMEGGGELIDETWIIQVNEAGW